jgi:hypothetical protein
MLPAFRPAASVLLGSAHRLAVGAGRLKVVSSASNGVADGSENQKDEADHQYQDPNGPHDGDLRQESDDEQNNT